ncbi:rRNA methyltransferase 1, mitochondrial [Synchiropus splendidus]|uniref:rRNA methyltransferase 1, mitochondrial n=1 Tax=Synchiropus splendidus TaxID=270530 RepID=UPI00237EE947|nr:rRNA methyltransferase 1, mitochondrial [Synchiropus splendidus]XP_053727988.1 rRNA methyltransferase 1, mitochondrial [Synchiropus splendidus]
MLNRRLFIRTLQNPPSGPSGLFWVHSVPRSEFFHEVSDTTSKKIRQRNKSDGWKEKAAQRKVQKIQNQWSTHKVGVSSEVKRLSEEGQSVSHRGKSQVDVKPYPYEAVFGVVPCLLALTQGRRKIFKLFVKDQVDSQRTSVLQVCQEAHQRGVPVQRVSKGDLERMSAAKVHQGVCLKASPLSFLTDDATESRTGNNYPLWLVLDQVQDPMNLGAILRSAYFLGVDRVASSIQKSCHLTPVVSKASSGVMEVMGVYGYENLQDLVQEKLARGWHVVGTVGADAQKVQTPVVQCSDFHMTKPTLLLLGGEGQGLSLNLLKLCHTLVTIPAGRVLLPGIDSLNVSVAAGVLLHSLLRSRTRA